MVRIQVIYCGGCREAYDRGEWLGELQTLLAARVGEVEMCHFQCDDARIRLIMFGCTAACMNPDTLPRQPDVPQHSIGPGGYFDGVIHTFEEIADILAQEISGTKGASA